jgi:hypothetical protein
VNTREKAHTSWQGSGVDFSKVAGVAIGAIIATAAAMSI